MQSSTEQLLPTVRMCVQGACGMRHDLHTFDLLGGDTLRQFAGVVLLRLEFFFRDGRDRVWFVRVDACQDGNHEFFWTFRLTNGTAGSISTSEQLSPWLRYKCSNTKKQHVHCMLGWQYIFL